VSDLICTEKVAEEASDSLQTHTYIVLQVLILIVLSISPFRP
jgi:hypothetical protein